MPGFLLGLSTGVTCVAYCAPVLFPYLIGGSGTVRDGVGVTLRFMTGRLAGYLLFAILAWVTNRVLVANVHSRSLIYSLAYLGLAFLMLFYGGKKPKPACAAHFLNGRREPAASRRPIMPVLMGFLTGLNLCPPFITAFTGAAGSGSLAGSLTYFATFFAGTSVYFIPVPFLKTLARYDTVRQIGRGAALIVGLYYLYLGIIMVGGGSGG
jgi:sulfite exporter TauE/SafE